MTTEYDDAGYEPPHTSSPTDHILTERQFYGYRPFQDEPHGQCPTHRSSPPRWPTFLARRR